MFFVKLENVRSRVYYVRCVREFYILMERNNRLEFKNIYKCVVSLGLKKNLNKIVFFV